MTTQRHPNPTSESTPVPRCVWRSVANAACAICVGAALTLYAANASAWGNNYTYCVFGFADVYWGPGSHAMNPCVRTKAFPEFPNSPLPSTQRNYASTRDAMAWAHWMWYRWGGTSASIWLNNETTHNCASGTWWENGNEVNEVWFEARGSGADLATEYTDHLTCIFGGGKTKILASDIVINSSVA